MAVGLPERVRGVAAAVGLVLAAGCGGGLPDEPAPVTRTAGYRLAVDDGVAAPDQATVDRYDAAIEETARLCHGTVALVEDMAGQTSDLLTRGGVRVTNLDALEGIGRHSAPLGDCVGATMRYTIKMQGPGPRPGA